jgi:uncharacterized protein (DUF4415 family)
LTGCNRCDTLHLVTNKENPMSPTIRIDDDVYQMLKAHAEPFVDTPNSVLRRVFNLDPSKEVPDETDFVDTEPPRLPKLAAVVTPPTPSAGPTPTARPTPTSATSRRRSKKPSTTTKRHRAPAGALLPEVRYELPLLSALLELGGAAPSRELIDLVGEKLKNDLTDVDNEQLKSGGIRWQSRVQFVRLRLIERGFMTKEAPRGVWAISEAGRKFVDEHESGVA